MQDPRTAVSHGRIAAWLTVAVLCIAQVISTVDRGMLALLVEPVRADLGIDDVGIALLQGFAFAVFYVSVGLPLGFVADAVNRRWLLVAGIAVWSVATVASGLAASFGHLFAARMVVGIGEAVLGPCAVGMIAELFPPERRGRPMALYVLGSMIAVGLGSTVTSTILDAAPRGAFAGWPLMDGLPGWRIAFVVFGCAGLPVALLLSLLRDTGGRRAGTGPGAVLVQARATIAGFVRRGGFFLRLYGAVALFAMGGAAVSAWAPAMLARRFGASAAQAGHGLGGPQLLWALAGAAVASVLVDRVGRGAAVGSVAPARIRLCGWIALATIPASMGFLMPGLQWAAVASAEVMFTSALFGTAMLSVLAEVVGPGARGVAVALYAFVMTMIGASLGPLAVAVLTEHVFASPASIGPAMASVGSIALAGSLVLALQAAGRWTAEV